MKKTICDRCMAEIIEKHQFSNPTYQIKRHTGEIVVNTFVHDEYMADVDLCPKCMEEFEEFMAGRMLLWPTTKREEADHDREQE